MSFSFNFNFSDDEDDDSAAPTIGEIQTSSTLKAKEDEIIKVSGEFDPIKNDLFQKSNTISTVTAYTDVIHGVYEGGLKIWECSDDLLAHLSHTTVTEDHIGARVVDLGCGHGHPGIWCLTRGASVVCFQDLNVDALSVATVPNVLRVCGAKPVIKSNPPPIMFNSPLKKADHDDDTNLPQKPTEEQPHEDISLLKLENLVASNQNLLVNAKSLDLVQYEKIKALVLAGEETDPEMLEFLIEIEEEMALDNLQAQSQNNNNHQNGEKGIEVKELIQAVQNYGYMLPDQKNTALTPHATFIFGPWGQYELEKYMLEGNKHQLLTLSSSKPLQVDESGPIQSPTDVDLDVFPTKQQFQSSFTQYLDASNEKTALLELLKTTTQHFTNPIHFNTSLQCVLTLTSSINANSDVPGSKAFPNVYQLSFNPPTPRPVTQSLVDSFNQLAITTPSSIDPTSPPTISVLLSINPAQINIVKSNTTHPFLYTPILQFLRVFGEVLNAIFTTIIHNTQENNPTMLPTTLPTISQHTTTKQPQYCYTQSTSTSSKSYLFTTTLSATESSEYYQQFLSSGFTETSWNEPLEFDRVNTSTIISNQPQQSSAANLPQFRSVSTTFAQLFTYQLPPKTTPIDNQFTPEHIKYNEYISMLLSTLNLTTFHCIPSSLAYSSKLWYGSHPINSPFRYNLILSSDTIYSSPTMPVFLQTIRSLLSISGKALIAAKRYYFGVGGSTAEFSQHVTNCPDLNVKTVKVFSDGSSNIREILEITWNQDVVEALW